MKPTILFIQGGGAGMYDKWDNLLVDSLQTHLGPGYPIRYPQMPNEDDPSASAWERAILEQIQDLPPGSILVGHSVGATILLRTIAEHPDLPPASGCFLIAAPFVGEGGWPSDDFEFDRHLGTKLPADLPIHVFHGTADDTAPLHHVDLYAACIPQAHIHRLHDRDHQMNNDLAEVAREIAQLG